jgi:carbon monoxide dehydrogenase subunit G
MELSNAFSVGVPVDEAWKVIVDLERIAPCMPGAELQEVEGDEYRGVVKIKVGPITAQYKGVASFVERDEAAHRAVLKAEGRDTRGQGNASALITARLVPEGDTSTRITVDTDLTITGKVAQFGRGVLADISTKLIGQFADSLNAELTTGGAGDAGGAAAEAGSGAGSSAGEASVVPGSGVGRAEAPSGTAFESSAGEASVVPGAGPRKIQSKPAEPIDLLGSAGSPVVRRVGPIVGVVVVLLWLLRRRRRRR